MDLREIGWGSVDWIQLAQDRDRWQAVVNTVMNLRVLAPRSWFSLDSECSLRDRQALSFLMERVFCEICLAFTKHSCLS
jgi:hypothetical protein